MKRNQFIKNSLGLLGGSVALALGFSTTSQCSAKNDHLFDVEMGCWVMHISQVFSEPSNVKGFVRFRSEYIIKKRFDVFRRALQRYLLENPYDFEDHKKVVFKNIPHSFVKEFNVLPQFGFNLLEIGELSNGIKAYKILAV